MRRLFDPSSRRESQQRQGQDTPSASPEPERQRDPTEVALETLRAGLNPGAPDEFHTTDAFQQALQTLLSAGRELAALDILRAYVARNPADYGLRRTLAERLLARGDREGAVAPLTECADAPDPAVRAWALFQLADRYHERGEDARALALYQEVLAIDYRYPRAKSRAREIADKMGLNRPPPSMQPTMTQAAPERVAVGSWRVLQELGRGGRRRGVSGPRPRAGSGRSR